MKKNQIKQKIILTGDRPTGPLHLGHFVGSLENRVKLQKEYKQYIMIADVQALTDNAENPKKIQKNIYELILDYLSVGIDPKINTIFIQSMVPELTELTIYFLNLVTLPCLQRNPTVKQEIKEKKFSTNVSAGFLMYPISQAADITAFKANLVPVGEDQLPMIEQTSEIVKKFNKYYGKILIEPKALISKTARLPGTDGKNKMSKSLNNAIYLSDSSSVVKEKIMKMFTDPKHIHINDPGKIKGNPVFSYLDAFAQDKKMVEEMKTHYQKGGLGDVEVKQKLITVLEEFLRSIRVRRKELEKDNTAIIKILEKGAIDARKVAVQTLNEVRNAIGINYF
ncbi:MAG: tryptophan--tRNA ligase [Candidatus Pacebacteria bacterium]|nr:tryptophan--tRNA ligase [Candidatus Paceibacterota bacterium]